MLRLALMYWTSEASEIAVMAGFGTIPAVLFGEAQLPPELLRAPAWLTLMTGIMLHASFAHLIGNMLFLWVFGDNVEDAMGHLRFLVFFLLCGMAGALLHALMNPESEQPLIGASGAISGVIASYLMLYPRVRIWGPRLQMDPAAHPGDVCPRCLDPVSAALGAVRPARGCRLVGASRRAWCRSGADAAADQARATSVWGRRTGQAVTFMALTSPNPRRYGPSAFQPRAAMPVIAWPADRRPIASLHNR
ncbi:rhomboid family intramembrane serine protease [Bosea vestrisii]|uniref:rhomboid family intramembrane serine protease n=1 Tax=Bosea vestrisii TaxID=151416 RepID=UPI003D7697C4